MWKYNDIFSKGLCDGYDNMPISYSPFLRNNRIVNKTTIPRNWYLTLIDDIAGGYNQWMATNKNQEQIYTVIDKKVYIVDPGKKTMRQPKFTVMRFGKDLIQDNVLKFTINWEDITIKWTNNSNNETIVNTVRTLESKGYIARKYATESIATPWNYNTVVVALENWDDVDITNAAITWGSSQSSITVENNKLAELTYLIDWELVSFSTFDEYTVFFVWSSAANSVFDWLFFQQIGYAKARSWDQRFGNFFLNFHFAAGRWSRKNNLYISAPISATAKENFYDWGWSWAEILVMKSPIKALTTTKERLFIFTEDSIEFISKASLQTIGGQAWFVTEPFSQGDDIVNDNCVVAAWSKVFYLTNNKEVKAVNYVKGVDRLEVWSLSDVDSVSIQKTLNNLLNDDLSSAFGFYDSKRKLVKWFVRSKKSTFNDICLIWDLINKTFLIDDNKYFWPLTEYKNRIFAWSSINSTIYEDESGKDDDWDNLHFIRLTAPLTAWTNSNKVFSSARTSWSINTITKIEKTCLIDWSSVYHDTIEKKKGFASWSWSLPTWSFATWEEIWEIIDTVKFLKYIWPDKISGVWKNMQFKYDINGKWIDFVLESVETTETPTTYIDNNDL